MTLEQFHAIPEVKETIEDTKKGIKNTTGIVQKYFVVYMMNKMERLAKQYGFERK